MIAIDGLFLFRWFQLLFEMLGTNGKKKISQLAIKKTAPVRLVKCYVCNKFFNGQQQLAVHLQQHQSKLNRTTVEEIQRKTQENFRTKRQPSAATRSNNTNPTKDPSPVAITVQQKTGIEKEEDEEVKFQGEEQIESQGENETQKQQKELQEALRESQVLLERIDFLTQITEDTPQLILPPPQEDKEEERNLDEHELYQQLLINQPESQAQTLILRTNFEEESFLNYQEQLKHLKNLLRVAVNAETIAKIKGIANHITSDVKEELRLKYSSIPSVSASNTEKQVMTEGSNHGEVRYCSICYIPIEAGSQFMHSQFGSAYHSSCLEEQSEQ